MTHINRGLRDLQRQIDRLLAGMADREARARLAQVQSYLEEAINVTRCNSAEGEDSWITPESWR